MERKNLLSLVCEVLHLVVIFFIGEKLISNNFSFIVFNVNKLLSGLLFLIVIFKPVNTNFKIFFGKYASEKLNDDKNTTKFL